MSLLLLQASANLAFGDPDAVPVPAQALPATAKMKVVVHGLDFEGDSAVIQPEALPILDETARVAHDTGIDTILVVIDQSTPEPRSATHRAILMQQRAKAVRHFLRSRGVSAGRITIRELDAPPLSLADKASSRPAELSVQ
ncbi:MAG TPA: OmpA family protein [Candidatus Acidoferrales bacterium]|nr:OmpA family protein [Candidatus Acidoferrales bacterium]